MIFLRIVLYFICFISISWSALFFGAPVFVPPLVKVYTDGAVFPSNVEVSPGLNISIGRLDFKLEKSPLGIPLHGFSRSTEISWSFSREKSFLDFDFGPTFFKDYATAENLKVSTVSFNQLDWQDLKLTLKAKSIDLKTIGKLEYLSLVGNYIPEISMVSHANFEALMVESEDNKSSWSAELVSGELHDLSFNVPVSKQFFEGNFFISNFQRGDSKSDVSIANGTIAVVAKNTNLTFDFQDLKLPSIDTSISRVKGVANYDAHNFFKDAQVVFLDGILGRDVSNFSRIDAEISAIDSYSYDVHVNGDLGDFELYNSDNFIGMLPPSNFNIDFQYNGSTFDLNAESQITFDVANEMNINGQTELGLSFAPRTNLVDCFFEDCMFSSVDIYYKVNVNDEFLSGRSVCPVPVCNFETTSHSITTSNTDKIFTTLNQAGIANPVYSFFLYSVITSGTKIDEGHQLKF